MQMNEDCLDLVYLFILSDLVNAVNKSHTVDVFANGVLNDLVYYLSIYFLVLT